MTRRQTILAAVRGQQAHHALAAKSAEKGTDLIVMPFCSINDGDVAISEWLACVLETVEYLVGDADAT